jgi:glutamate--cysteine ligase
LDQAWDIIADWSFEEVRELRGEAGVHGMAGSFRGMPVRELANKVVELAREGLGRRGCVDNAGTDETGFLVPLAKVAQSGRTLSDELLDLYHGAWNETVDPVFKEFAY